MILSRREKMVLYTTVTVVVLAGANFLFLAPFEEKIERMEKEEKTLLGEKTKLLRYLRHEAEFRGKISEIDAIIPQSSPEEMSTEFQVHLRELAQKARLQVTDSKYLEQASVLDQYKKMVFAIRFECDIRQLRDYMYYVETSPRLLKISQLDIVQRQRESEKLSVNMRLSTLVKAQ